MSFMASVAFDLPVQIAATYNLLMLRPLTTPGSLRPPAYRHVITSTAFHPAFLAPPASPSTPSQQLLLQQQQQQQQPSPAISAVSPLQHPPDRSFGADETSRKDPRRHSGPSTLQISTSISNSADSYQQQMPQLQSAGRGISYVTTPQSMTASSTAASATTTATTTSSSNRLSKQSQRWSGGHNAAVSLNAARVLTASSPLVAVPTAATTSASGQQTIPSLASMAAEEAAAIAALAEEGSANSAGGSSNSVDISQPHLQPIIRRSSAHIPPLAPLTAQHIQNHGSIQTHSRRPSGANALGKGRLKSSSNLKSASTTTTAQQRASAPSLSAAVAAAAAAAAAAASNSSSSAGLIPPYGRPIRINEMPPLRRSPMFGQVSYTYMSMLVSRVIYQLWMPDRSISSSSPQFQEFMRFWHSALHKTQLSSAAIFHALRLVARFRTARPMLLAGPGSEYRILTVALMLATKYLDDHTYSTHSWSTVVKIPPQEIVVMQKEFLISLEHQIGASREEYVSWLEQLGQYVRNSDLFGVTAGEIVREIELALEEIELEIYAEINNETDIHPNELMTVNEYLDLVKGKNIAKWHLDGQLIRKPVSNMEIKAKNRPQSMPALAKRRPQSIPTPAQAEKRDNPNNSSRGSPMDIDSPAANNNSNSSDADNNNSNSDKNSKIDDEEEEEEDDDESRLAAEYRRLKRYSAPAPQVQPMRRTNSMDQKMIPYQIDVSKSAAGAAAQIIRVAQAAAAAGQLNLAASQHRQRNRALAASNNSVGVDNNVAEINTSLTHALTNTPSQTGFLPQSIQPGSANETSLPPLSSGSSVSLEALSATTYALHRQQQLALLHPPTRRDDLASSSPVAAMASSTMFSPIALQDTISGHLMQALGSNANNTNNRNSSVLSPYSGLVMPARPSIQLMNLPSQHQLPVAMTPLFTSPKQHSYLQHNLNQPQQQQQYHHQQHQHIPPPLPSIDPIIMHSMSNDVALGLPPARPLKSSQRNASKLRLQQQAQIRQSSLGRNITTAFEENSTSTIHHQQIPSSIDVSKMHISDDIAPFDESFDLGSNTIELSSTQRLQTSTSSAAATTAMATATAAGATTGAAATTTTESLHHQHHQHHQLDLGLTNSVNNVDGANNTSGINAAAAALGAVSMTRTLGGSRGVSVRSVNKSPQFTHPSRSLLPTIDPPTLASMALAGLPHPSSNSNSNSNSNPKS